MNFESKSFRFQQGDRPVVIAEVGVNHNCDMALAKKLVDTAKACGADIVKFQAFVAEEEISRFADKAQYQKDTTGGDGGQLEMARALELSHAQLREIKDYCRNVEMPFLCTAFDDLSLAFIVEDLGVSSVKIASSEVTNHPFLARIAKTGVGIILSTGASDLQEVVDAVEVIRSVGDNELVVLHCVSNYPAQKNQLNLRAIETMRETLNLPIGYSDHSCGTEAPTVAAALGAVLVEKHFTLDRQMAGPDHLASIEPDELRRIVDGVKLTFDMLGDGEKSCVACEKPNQGLIRKSLVASRFLPKGTQLTERDVKIKRPATGIPPYKLDETLGGILLNDIEEDQPLRPEAIHNG